MSALQISVIQATTNTNAYNTVVSLSEAGWLCEVITTLAYTSSGVLAQLLNLLPQGRGQLIQRELSRRTWYTPYSGVIRSHPELELLRLALARLDIGNHFGTVHKHLVDRVFLLLDQHTARRHLNNVDAVYAYEDVAATTFERAKMLGIRCFYDLPTLHYRTVRAIQTEEAERYPDLSTSLVAIQEPDWKLYRKDQEVEFADHIFVASSITRRSLTDIGIQEDRISVIPYGAPIDYFRPHPKTDNKFRPIFVGRISPAKGIHYLIQAWAQLDLPGSELLLIGSNRFPAGWLNSYSNCFRHIASVPHQILDQYYNNSSVFVFPSLLDGFGLVLLEAMACGLPVITTPNTAGPDIITDGIEGFIIPIRDVDALKEKLEWCYQHPQELAEMGQAARRKAEHLSWHLYRQRLANRILEVYQQLA